MGYTYTFHQVQRVVTRHTDTSNEILRADGTWRRYVEYGLITPDVAAVESRP